MNESCGVKLSVELVPQTCWYSNVRSEVSGDAWDRLRKRVYEDAEHRCEICSGQGDRHPVECHEVWHYDDVNHIQRLVRMIALCPRCHEVKHFGLSESLGKGKKVFWWLKAVNQWSQEETDAYLDEAAEIWGRRSDYDWTLDVSVLESEYRCELLGVSSAMERAAQIDVDALFD